MDVVTPNEPLRRRRERAALPPLPPFRPRAGRPVEDELLRHLRRALMAGAFAPGQPVTSRALAELCGVSATPARVALHELSAEGVLVRRERSAYHVAPATADIYAEMLQIRLRLEGLAAREAATRITPTVLAEVRKLQDRLARLRTASPTYLELNYAFHFCIYQEAGMPRLLDMIGRAWTRVGPSLSFVGEVYSLAELNPRHDAIIAALEARDADAAETTLRADIEGAAQALVPWLREGEAKAA